MKRRRHTPEQIIWKLAEGEKFLDQGRSIEEVSRHLEVTESTGYRWHNQYGSMKADDAKRLKELEKENEHRKLLAAYYSGAIDVPTLTTEQAWVGSAFDAAKERLADLDANLGEQQQNLE